MRVPRAYAVADAGQIINPDGLSNQIEGGIIQSTSWTLHEHVRFDRDAITSRDWVSYPILTMPEVPKIEVALINRPDERALGAGEGSQGPAVAAIANAFAREFISFRARGDRQSIDQAESALNDQLNALPEGSAQRGDLQDSLNKLHSLRALTASDSRVIARAEPPSSPSNLGLKQILLLAGILGLALGLVAALVVESMDKYGIFREDPIFVKFTEEIIKPNTEDSLVLDFEMDPGKDVRFS